MLGGIADTLDGRVARATGTGSRFGEELDSLVDAISFGFAPALIMYFGVLNRGVGMADRLHFHGVRGDATCAVQRRAGGTQKDALSRVPSPAAGLTLATYYWFGQTPLYNQTVILFTDSKTLSDLPWPTILRGLMAVLAALMISDVPYPTSRRSDSAAFGSCWNAGGCRQSCCFSCGVKIHLSGVARLRVVRRREMGRPRLLRAIEHAG